MAFWAMEGDMSAAEIEELINNAAALVRDAAEGLDAAEAGTHVRRRAIREVSDSCKFCVTVADPVEPDAPIIAVSEGFEAMTHYSQKDILGCSCRFLSNDCPVDTDELMKLRLACQTAKPFWGFLPRRRKTGELFVSFVDLRGLHVGCSEDGKDVWYLVGIQADVTGLVTEGTTAEPLEALAELAGRVRERLTLQLGQFVLAAADDFRRQLTDESTHSGSAESCSSGPRRIVALLEEPAWISEKTVAGRTPPTLSVSRGRAVGDALSYESFIEAYTAASEEADPSTPETRRRCISAEISLVQELIKHEDSSVRENAGVKGWKETNKDVMRHAIRDVAEKCSFCVSVADPDDPILPLVAVSPGFEAMTGYNRRDILGQNCRFLNEGCPVSMEDKLRLRLACMTGRPFTGLLPNRKKDGQLFVNLLDLRGLVVGAYEDGRDAWCLVGIQSDVTGLAAEEMPAHHLVALREVAASIRERLTQELFQVITSAGDAPKRQSSEETTQTSGSSDSTPSCRSVTLLDEPRWISGSDMIPLLSSSPSKADTSDSADLHWLADIAGAAGAAAPPPALPPQDKGLLALAGMSCVLVSSFLAGVTIGRRLQMLPQMPSAR